MCDLTEHLNELNIRLQGRNHDIVQLYNNVKSFAAKLDLWIEQLRIKEFFHFPTLLSVASKENTVTNTYIEVLDNLKIQFNEVRFADFRILENEFKLYVNPFSVNVMSVALEYQMEVTDLQNDIILQCQFNNSACLDIYQNLCGSKYPKLRAFAATIAAMFGSTYICEQFFSKLNHIKCKNRARLSNEHLRDLLHIATYNEIPDFEYLTIE